VIDMCRTASRMRRDTLQEVVRLNIPNGEWFTASAILARLIDEPDLTWPSGHFGNHRYLPPSAASLAMKLRGCPFIESRPSSTKANATFEYRVVVS